MNQGTHPEELPAEVLDDVASVVGAEVTLLSRLPGGVNAGAMRVQLAGRADAVLKAVPRAHPNHLDETLRAQRVVEHMRRRGYPTPAWLGVGATATHVWHLMDFVDAAPAPELVRMARSCREAAHPPMPLFGLSSRCPAESREVVCGSGLAWVAASGRGQCPAIEVA
jgi:hypothetical protein